MATATSATTPACLEEELVGFLTSANPGVRRQAMEGLSGMHSVLVGGWSTPPSTTTTTPETGLVSTEQQQQAAAAARIVMEKAIGAVWKIGGASSSEECPQTRAMALRVLANLAEDEANASTVLCAGGSQAAEAGAETERKRAEGEERMRRLVKIGVEGGGRHECSSRGCTKQAEKRCSRCHTAWYCGAECARKGWATHREVCKLIVATMAAGGGGGGRGVGHDESGLGYLAMAVVSNISRSLAACGMLCNVMEELVEAAVVLGRIGGRCTAAAECAADVVMNAVRDSGCCTAVVGSVGGSGRGQRESPLALLVNELMKRPKSVGVPGGVRRSVAGAVRNVCFDTTQHKRLLSPAIALDSALLSLFRGSNTTTTTTAKTRDERAGTTTGAEGGYEPDLETRKMGLEALLMLVCKRETRAELIRRQELYPVMRDYDLWEHDEGCKERVAQIVDLLIRDSEGDATTPVARPLLAPCPSLPAPSPTPSPSSSAADGQAPAPSGPAQPPPIPGLEDI